MKYAVKTLVTQPVESVVEDVAGLAALVVMLFAFLAVPGLT